MLLGVNPCLGFENEEGISLPESFIPFQPPTCMTWPETTNITTLICHVTMMYADGSSAGHRVGLKVVSESG